MRLALLVLAAALAGCYTPPQTLELRLELPPELAERGAELRVFPGIAEARREVSRGVVGLELKRETGQVQLELAGACPLSLDTRKLGAIGLLSLRSLFELGPSERIVGVGRRFELRAAPACREAEALRSSFELVEGASLAQIEFGRDGRSFSATSSADVPLAKGPGIIAVSARQQQERRAELAFRVSLPSGERLERRLFVSALARSSGLPNVGLGHPVLLAGGGWKVLEQPPGSSASLRALVGADELEPDVAGLFRLEDAQGRELRLRSSRYDQVPLDCGRAECHAQIAQSIRESPMTGVLESDLGGCHDLSDPACALRCHTVGEPGTPDGGFSHVMQELALTALPSEYENVPLALRRLGGVGCLACHGPSRIPEPAERPRLLTSDVCAVCHDAPPRYGHVQALESTRMGHADARPETRREPCARCHTAAGALGRPAPEPAQPEAGISCATCHDVHPHDGAAHGARVSQNGLMRAMPLPTSLSGVSVDDVTRVCASCHAPGADATLPEASSAALVLGRGGWAARDGAALELSGPHAKLERGCMACHSAGPPGLTYGQSHGFAATEQACRRCHGAAKPRDPSLAERARELVRRLEPARTAASANEPWHARSLAPAPRSPQQARALFDALLVLEDPAADVHNPAYAKQLLDEAEAGARP